MAHRPTNPSPYFERVDATKDIDVKFMVADHDTVASAKVIVRSNNLSGGIFPTACELTLSNGKLRATNCTERVVSDGSNTISMSVDFESISSVTVGGSTTTAYNYSRDSHQMYLANAPASGTEIVVVGDAYISGDWQTKVCGGNGEDSFVKMCIPANTLTNGNEYKWQVEKLNDVSVDNREFYFCTKATPIVTIATPAGDEITSESAIFSGVCEDDIEYYRWEIRDEDGDIIDETENIYNSNLDYMYSGLFAGDIISVSLYVKIKMQAEEAVSTKEYSINYSVYNNQITVKTVNDPYNNSLKIDFTGLSYIGGRSSALKYTLADGIVHIDDGEYLQWNDKSGEPLQLPDGTGYSIKFKLDTGFCGTIMEVNDASGAFKFGYDGAFWYEINGVREAVDMSAWFSKASMFQPSGSSDNDKIYTFGVADTIDFSSAGTVIKIADGTFAYWWYLKYYNNQVFITKGGAVSGT